MIQVRRQSKPLESHDLVWNRYLIGPYFFEENVNRVNFLELLRYILPELLENVEQQDKEWIQLDGSPPHYAHIVRNYHPLQRHVNQAR